MSSSVVWSWPDLPGRVYRDFRRAPAGLRRPAMALVTAKVHRGHVGVMHMVRTVFIPIARDSHSCYLPDARIAHNTPHTKAKTLGTFHVLTSCCWGWLGCTRIPGTSGGGSR